ncbi:MAG: dTDP-4-dehydrorhamnose reductase [Chthoniobacterales bacterium]
MKILLVGNKGRLGAALERHFSSQSDVELHCWNRADVDLENKNAVARAAENLSLQANDAILYAAGMTRLEECENKPRQAIVINVETPELLARKAAEHAARFIYFSTDYVFDGTATTPYTETDAANPTSIYGQSKLAGERLVLAADPNHFVIRVSWLFGPDQDGAHFVNQFLRRAKSGETLEAIADKFSVPSFTPDLAEATANLLRKNIPGGLYHLCNVDAGQPAVSWLDYAKQILTSAVRANILDRVPPVKPIRLADMEQMQVKRPPYSAMNTAKFIEATHFPLRSWKIALDDYMQSVRK